MVLALLEAQARLAAQGISGGGPTDRDRIEDGRLDDHGRGPLPDLARRAAHDAGDGQRAARVRDDQGVRGQVAPDVIERLEPLAGVRQTNHDGTGLDGRAIEGVDRLAELEHHVVAGIDDVGDRALTGRHEAELDVQRRRADLHAVDPATDEPGAEDRIIHTDRAVLGRRVARLGHLDDGHPQARAGGRRHLARQPQDRERVATVRLDVDVQHDVAVERAQGTADGRRGGQDEDALGIGGQPQLITRAEHAFAGDAHLGRPLDVPVAGQDGAWQRHGDTLTGGDVRGTTDDREGRVSVVDAHAGEREAVCVGMWSDLEQLAHDDRLPVVAASPDAPDLHAQHGQAGSEVLRRELDIHELAQPGQRHVHQDGTGRRRMRGTGDRGSTLAQ